MKTHCYHICENHLFRELAQLNVKKNDTFINFLECWKELEPAVLIKQKKPQDLVSTMVR
jgi:hypothetical protein